MTQPKLSKLFSGIFAVATIATLSGCMSQTFDTPQKLGGKWVSSKTLNLGHDTYMNYCMQCHGISGEGNGPASIGLNPQPRNFTQGIYKFASVTSGELPLDEDLKHVIRNGLRGTPMLPWDISDERLEAVVQYIKTFSPVWKTQTAGTPQKLTPDPFGAERASEAIALGKKVYHGMAQCYTCHPTYASLKEISAYSKEMTGNEVSSIRENPELSVLQDSSYGHKFMPPDYTKIDIKTGGDIASLYKVLGTGVGGTSMPAWKNMLSPSGNEEESEKRLWALAYYVNSLHKLKYDFEARKAFFAELNAQRAGDHK
ncbi:MAG: c-type cytochrome [Bdellovibrionales bacterium]|nr:c-type cytochrome [Bdellovibrionales bacterium]